MCVRVWLWCSVCFFFFKDRAPPEINTGPYTLPLPAAFPICLVGEQTHATRNAPYHLYTAKPRHISIERHGAAALPAGPFRGSPQASEIRALG
jgi:hypothetical protein